MVGLVEQISNFGSGVENLRTVKKGRGMGVSHSMYISGRAAASVHLRIDPIT